MNLLKMAPCLVERPWGGRRLQTVLGKKLPEGLKIGESWELSDHAEGPSSISEGPFEGLCFGELLRKEPRQILGVDSPPVRYPLLVKYIDAAEDLSIQVHPDDAYTRKHHLPDRGKTECWFIMDCEPESEIIYGLHAGISRCDLEHAIQSKSVPKVVKRVPIKPGTFLFVPAGLVHAILGGTLLCEIQQSSNITYRLWDWDRQPPRPLHIQESLDVIQFDSSVCPEPVQLSLDSPPSPTEIILTDNPFFSVTLLSIPPDTCWTRTTPKFGGILNVVRGGGHLSGFSIKQGDTLFTPACVDTLMFQTTWEPLFILLSISNE